MREHDAQLLKRICLKEVVKASLSMHFQVHISKDTCRQYTLGGSHTCTTYSVWRKENSPFSCILATTSTAWDDMMMMLIVVT